VADKSRTVKINIVGDDKHLTGAIGNANTSLGKFGAAAAAAGAVAAVAIGAAAVGLVKLGDNFDKASATIRTGTGATGEQLAGLEQSFKNVAKSVPASFADASQAVADLNTRTGATGPQLEALSTQFLELSRITKTDLGTNIESVTRVFGDWGVAVDQQGPSLDKLFRASQATGIQVDTLSSQLVQYGAPLRQLGFDMDTSAALLGKFEKEGVNAELVMGSMRIALGKMARDGEPAQETFMRVTDQIKNAGSASEANALALELFGARAGPDMAAAIREGRFEVGELVNQLSTGGDTIMGVADETLTLGDRFKTMGNTIGVALEPAASAITQSLGSALQSATPMLEQLATTLGAALGPALETLGPLLGQMGGRFATILEAAMPLIPSIAKVGETITKILAAGLDAAGPIIELAADALISLLDAVTPLLGPLVDIAKVLGGFIAKAIEMLMPFITRLLDTLGETLMNVLVALTPGLETLAEAVLTVLEAFMPMLDPILDVVDALAPLLPLVADLVTMFIELWAPIMEDQARFLSAVLTPVLQVVAKVVEALAIGIDWALRTIIMPLFETFGGVATRIFGGVSSIIMWAWDAVIQPIWAAIQWAKAQGCSRYDMWGVPDVPQERLEADFQEREEGLWGVYRFKRGWGGDIVRTVGSTDRVNNKLLYRLYQWRRGT